MIMDEKLKKLRSQGTLLKPKFIIGKNGLTGNVIVNIKNELKKTPLVKIKILGSFIEHKDKRSTIDDLIEKTDAKLVQFIGFTIVITRK
jgi:RNA-binding protein